MRRRRLLSLITPTLVAGTLLVIVVGPSGASPAPAGTEVLVTGQATINGLSTVLRRDDLGHSLGMLDAGADVQRRPAVSPIDGTVAVSAALNHEGGRYGLATITLSGHVHVLTTPVFADLDPAWSRDGKFLAAVRSNGDFNSAHCCRLIVVSLDGRVRTLSGAAGDVNDPVWSPNGTSIFYTDARGLERISTKGGPAHLVVRGHGFQEPAWSPDGRRIVLVQRLAPGRERLLMFDRSSHRLRALGHWSNAVESPQWDPDGQGLLALAYVGDGDTGRTSVTLVHVALDGRHRAIATLSRFTHGLGRGFVIAVPAPSPSPVPSPPPSPAAAPSPLPSPSPAPSPLPSPSLSPLPSPSESAAPQRA